MSDRRCTQPDHCLNPAWCKTSSRCMRDSEPEIIRPTITRPEPDCRLCRNFRDCSDHGYLAGWCKEGNQYEPLPPVRLWRTI